MITLQRLKNSRAARNAGASYLAFLSTALCGLITVPVAVNYLTQAEMGLWTIVFVMVSYLFWLDLGIGNATGRKIADAIAKHNQTEINRWWTLSISILVILGFVMAAAAFLITQYLVIWLNIPTDQAHNAEWLFLTTSLVFALGMPYRAYPGLLLAQERFHWVPLIQAIMPWIQLVVFWILLDLGYGIRSYFPAILLSQFSCWIITVWQTHRKGFSVKLDFNGWNYSRFKELFTYSTSLATMAICSTIVNSLPSLLLSRIAGLPLVAGYNISNRGPNILSGLTSRISHAFYPNFQRLFVTGDLPKLMTKYRHVSELCIWISLIAAGAILAGNRTLVCWLAKENFYTGGWTNLWFACAVVIIPFVSNCGDLLQCSGKMGKAAIFSLIEIPVGLFIFLFSYDKFLLPGLAASFAFLPLLVRGPYYLLAAPAHCGFKTWTLCGNSILAFIIVMFLVVISGIWICSDSTTPLKIHFYGRETSSPLLRELTTGLILCLIGVFFSLRSLSRIKSA